MKNIRILAGSQFFGFCPSSEMISVLQYIHKREQKSFKISLIQHKNLEPLLEKEHSYLKLIRPNGQILNYLYSMDAQNKFDGFISFYEPSIIFYGWYFDKPTVLFDGLINLWDRKSFETTIYKDLNLFQQAKISRNFREFSKLFKNILDTNPHELLFSANILAGKKLIRNNDENEKIFKEYSELKDKTVITGNVINDYGIKRKTYSERKNIIVSLGGSLNPVVGFKQNIEYAKMIIKLCEYFIKFNDKNDYKWYFICHPMIYGVIKGISNLPSQLNLIPASSQKEYFSLLSSAVVALVPPSNPAIPEANYFGVPCFILPEENGGQPHYVATLSRNKYPLTLNLTLTNRIQNNKIAYKEFDVKKMYTDIKSLLLNKKYEKLRLSQVKKFYDFVLNKNNNEYLASLQLNAMTNYVGDFNGTQIIGNQTIDYIKEELKII